MAPDSISQEAIPQPVPDSISEKPIPQPPTPEKVLETKVPFPFETFNLWAEAFNHLRFEKGGKNQPPSVQMREDGYFTITLPENPSLGQILAVTQEFIRRAGIRDNPRLLTLTRDLRNMARLLAELVTLPPPSKDKQQHQLLTPEEQKLVEPLIVSLYHLGEGLEKAVKGEGYQNLTDVSSSQSLAASSYEIPEGANLEAYKGELFLRMLGKNQAFFDEKSLTDEKLSQVPQHSVYYYLLERFIEKEGKKQEGKKQNLSAQEQMSQEEKKQEGEEQNLSLQQQIRRFDQWLLGRKRMIVHLLIPEFLNPNRSPLEDGGRTHTALWQTIFSSFFFYFDQAIEEEGWKRAKEKLLPPPFANLPPNLQKELEKLLIPTQAEQSIITFFNLAGKKIEEKKDAPVYDKITLLLDLIQAYYYKETYKLTSAIEERAFECHLRSYILGRLIQDFLGNEVEVYTVMPTDHTKLLVYDKTTGRAYWVEPTPYPHAFQFPYIKGVSQKEWQKISQQRQADPDNFSIFGWFGDQFVTILPFQQGIEGGFWSNFGMIYRDEGLSEIDNQKRLELFHKAYYCIINALKLNPNNPAYHNNLALLYTERKLAKNDEEYFNNFNFAFLESKKAFDLNPTVERYDRFFWVIKTIPDEHAQKIFDHLSDNTKKIIWAMYQDREMRKAYRRIPIKFSLGFEKTLFWQIFSQRYLSRENKRLVN